MKWKKWIAITVEEGEIIPKGRIVAAAITSSRHNDKVVRRMLMISPSYRSWRKHASPWTFQDEYGWCVSTWVFGWNHLTHRPFFQIVWRPQEVDDI